MTDRLTAWWRLRTLREQRLLLVMGALLAIVILWLLVLRPLADARAGARARHELAVATLGRVRADADALRALGRSRPAALAAPLATVIGTALSTAGFANAAVTPQGTGRVGVVITTARPGALFPMLAELEARGILVERIATRANADPTLSVDMTLIGRAP